MLKLLVELEESEELLVKVEGEEGAHRSTHVRIILQIRFLRRLVSP